MVPGGNISYHAEGNPKKRNIYKSKRLLRVFDNTCELCLVRDDTYFLQTSRYIHLNPVKAHMVNNPEDYGWSSYRTMLGISDDKLTARDRTLSYFKGKDVYGYREFVEDRAHKYIVNEKEIRVSIGEDEQWLPW